MLVTLGSLSELCEGLAVPPLPLNIEGGRAKKKRRLAQWSRESLGPRAKCHNRNLKTFLRVKFRIHLTNTDLKIWKICGFCKKDFYL